MPKIFLTKTTNHYDLPSTTEILSFLDDKLKAAVVFEVSDDELSLLRKYYNGDFNYQEKTFVNVLVEKPSFIKQLELAKAYDLEQKLKNQKRKESEEKKKQKLAEKRNKKIF